MASSDSMVIFGLEIIQQSELRLLLHYTPAPLEAILAFRPLITESNSYSIGKA